MPDLHQLGRDFMAAIAANDQAQFEALLAEDAGLRLNRWDGREVYKPRTRVIQRLRDEWAAWPDAALETFDVLADGPRVAIEYRNSGHRTYLLCGTQPIGLPDDRGRQDQHHRSVLPGADL